MACFGGETYTRSRRRRGDHHQLPDAQDVIVVAMSGYHHIWSPATWVDSILEKCAEIPPSRPARRRGIDFIETIGIASLELGVEGLCATARVAQDDDFLCRRFLETSVVLLLSRTLVTYLCVNMRILTILVVLTDQPAGRSFTGRGQEPRDGEGT